MKKRMISILTAIALSLSLTACSNQDTSESTEGAAVVQPNSSYSGTVSAISTSSITVSADDGDVTIELTENTSFSREFGMGGQQPDGMGEMPSDMG